MTSEKEQVESTNLFSLCQNNILDVLVYFEAFNHPLRIEEILNNCSVKYSVDKTTTALSKLVDDEILFEFDGFFSLKPGVNILVNERLEKERHADRLFSKSAAYIRIIKSMPFVQAIAISGSMSKGVSHSKGDIDYFIITDRNRLWLARTLLILFKKVFLFNSRKFFCVNYFVDLDNFIVPDENIFTATEIAYLIPVYNSQLLDKFKSSNKWIEAYYPHFDHPIKRKEFTNSNKGKNVIKFLLKGMIGNALEEKCMQLTIKRWARKFPDFDPIKFELTMRSRQGVSKHHPRDFQNIVLNKIAESKRKLYPPSTTKL
mgnify:CR=1 FL=1